MNRKILAISFVLMMCLTSVVVLAAQSDDVSADERTGTIHPYMGGRGGSSKVYCSVESNKYLGPGYGGDFNESYIYFTADPNETIEKFTKGEVSSIGDFVVHDDLVKNTYYWAVSTYNPYGSAWTWNTYNLRMETIYLPAGTYEIEFSSTNMDGTRCSLYDFTSTHYFNEFKDGNGTVKVPLTEPGSFYVSAYSSGSSTAVSLAWTLNYRIAPAPPEQRTVDCEKDISVSTDKAWIHYTAKTQLPAGEYELQNYSGDNYYFVRGSTLETSFLENVVDKGLIDGSAYSVDHIDLDSPAYVDIYSVEEPGNRSSYTRSFSFEQKIYPDPVHMPSYYTYNYVYIEYSDEVVTESSSFKFYAGQNFSVAVDFDPSDYSYVILRSGTMYICMDPKKLYTVKAESASEYEIVAKVADGSTASINSANIKLHTEDVADPDNAGMTFAVVSIGFCAIAFFLLFYFGRRPKWDDSTGLPATGAVETVVNEIPEVPEEVPEAPTEEAPPEQPPEE